MPVIDITKDIDNLTLTITAEFAAPVQRVWDLYADPRQLEKVWGPPTYPATFVDHDLSPGSRITYYMTSPEGQKHCGLWDVKSVNEPDNFAFEDAFADENFVPAEGLPLSHCVYAFADEGGATKATYTTTYSSAEALQQVLDMGMEEGARESINQIDAFLAAS